MTIDKDITLDQILQGSSEPSSKLGINLWPPMFTYYCITQF